MEQDNHCPYCGEQVSVWLDPGSVGKHSYVEDCPVCCRPWQVNVWQDSDGQLYARLAHQDD